MKLRASIFLLAICSGTLAISPVAHATPTMPPLANVQPQAFAKMAWESQKIYVAGILDGLTFLSYGRNMPDHDAVVKCAKSRNLDELTHGVVAWVKAHPAFSESLGSAVAQTVSRACEI